MHTENRRPIKFKVISGDRLEQVRLTLAEITLKIPQLSYVGELVKKGYDELKKYTDNYLFEKNWGYGNLLNNFDIRAVNNDSVYLGWNDIKWYDYEDYEDVNAIVYGLKYLEENDYSYRFARLGEDYDDYEEKYYDSDSEKENHLEFPSVLREFEDEYIMDLMKVNDNLEK